MMATDAPSPLRLFDPEAEPYSEWAERMAALREQLREHWKVNRAPQPNPWRGVERRKKAR
jgi:hypothetical protein